MGASMDQDWGTTWSLADRASADVRADFISKTYLHLSGAVLAFVGIEAALLATPMARNLTELVLGLHQFGWLLFLGVFMVVSHVAHRWAHSAVSLGTQYAGLGLYVVAEAVIFAPLLYLAGRFNENIIPTAGIVTTFVFVGLTGIVFVTRKNFSFLAPALGIASMAAFGLILCSMIFGFSLGLLFTAAMIVFAGAYILYTTSNVLHEYHIGQHVAAALALFACVALLFWYVIQLVWSLSDRD